MRQTLFYVVIWTLAGLWGHTCETLPCREEFFYAHIHRDSIFTNMGSAVNSSWDDYDPMISADGMFFLFTSSRPQGGITNENIYLSEKINGVWSNAKGLSRHINTRGNEGSPFMSYDGSTVYYTACRRGKNSGSCDIYRAVKNKKGQWREEKVPYPISTPHWDAHPSLSPDGERMYFSSSRPGGKGGKDIWMSRKGSRGWETPIPLADINTSRDEVSPYIHADGKTLYFSSDGYGDGYGRLDFYVCRTDSRGRCDSLQNMGRVINDEHEQYSLRVGQDGCHGYFATDALMDGMGGLDICRFTLPALYAAHAVDMLLGRIKGESGETVSEMQIYVSHENGRELPHVMMSGGNYRVLLPVAGMWNIHVAAAGYMPYDGCVENDGGGETIRHDINLLSLKEGATFVVRGVHFPTDVCEIDSAGRASVERMAVFMKENPRVRIEVGGHTDNVGDEKYNMTLSLCRANAIKETLVEMGVEEDRITTVCYGDTRPVASNETEEGRSMNRRSEIKILSVQ